MAWTLRDLVTCTYWRRVLQKRYWDWQVGGRPLGSRRRNLFQGKSPAPRLGPGQSRARLRRRKTGKQESVPGMRAKAQVGGHRRKWRTETGRSTETGQSPGLFRAAAEGREAAGAERSRGGGSFQPRAGGVGRAGPRPPPSPRPEGLRLGGVARVGSPGPWFSGRRWGWGPRGPEPQSLPHSVGSRRPPPTCPPLLGCGPAPPPAARKEERRAGGQAEGSQAEESRTAFPASDAACRARGFKCRQLAPRVQSARGQGRDLRASATNRRPRRMAPPPTHQQFRFRHRE